MSVEGIDELAREVNEAMAGTVTYGYQIGGWRNSYMIVTRNGRAFADKYIGSPPRRFSIWEARRWAKGYIKASRKVDEQR